VNGAGITLDLMLGLWTQHHPRVPGSISATAQQQQAAAMQADHSTSPAAGWW
jgi:hypothetical protein